MTGFSGRDNNVALQTFGGVMDASPDALLALAADGTVLAVNAAAARLFALHRDAFTGLDHRLLIGEGFRDDVAHLLHQLLTHPEEHPPPLEISALRGDGTETAVELAVAVLPGLDPDGTQRNGAGISGPA